MMAIQETDPNHTDNKCFDRQVQSFKQILKHSSKTQ